MARENDAAKLERFESALAQFVERRMADRYVLAVVEAGSLWPETIWSRHALSLWIIEADGVTRRVASDGTGGLVFRILVENGVNIHAEVIPRSRFKKMVAGASQLGGRDERWPTTVEATLLEDFGPVDRNPVRRGLLSGARHDGSSRRARRSRFHDRSCARKS